MAKGDVLVRMKADVGNYNANLAAANRIMKSFLEENLSLGGVVKNMTRSFTGYAAGLMSIGAVAGKLHETVTEAVQLAKSAEGIRLAFNRLNDPSILDGLREATHGTVTDVELMKAAVKFNDFKLPLEELGTMLAFAQQKAKDTGQSVDYMVDSIVTGLGRKSLRILDNLGLSASEIKERMGETGDMTKAVGDIIRDQMAKVGDYVETAAERATKADVDLKNAMEDLGRTFLPLQEAGVNMFSQIEIAAVRLLKNAMEPLVEKFTEVGRKKALFDAGGGNAKVDRLIGNLNAARPENREKVYNQQVAKFNSYLYSRNRYLNALSAYRSPGGMTDANRKAIDEGFAKFGNNENAIRNQIKIQTAILEEYKKRAIAILEPVNKAITDPTKGDGKVGKAKKIKAEEIIPVGSVAALTKEMQELRKEQSLVTNVSDWFDYDEKIKDVNNRIKELKGELSNIEAGNMVSLGKIKALSIRDMVNAQTSADMIKRGDQRIKDFKAQEPTKQESDMTAVMSKMSSSVSGIASGLQQMGITIPQEIQSVIGILQGITTILTAIQTINSIKFWAGGGVVHANSGILVPGNNFSGDLVPSMINSGELILNQAQQGNIASQLQAASMINGGGGGGKDYVSGQNIFLGTNNYLKGSGQGQLVTTRMLRQYGLIS